MFEAGADTAIRSLQLRASRPALPDAERDIRDLDWPGAGGNDYVFIRRLEVTTPPALLSLRLAAEAQACLAAAVWAGDAGASGARAIRFRSLAELLGWLSADLAQGTYRWYWSRWRRHFELGPARALAALWSEQVCYLPAVTAWLADCGRLHAVWRRLDGAAAQTVLDAVGQFTGYRLEDATAEPPGPDSVLPASALFRWQAFLAGGDPGSAELRLAAVLLLWQYQPQRLVSAGAPRAIHTIAAALAAAPPATPPAAAAVDSDDLYADGVSAAPAFPQAPTVTGAGPSARSRRRSEPGLQPAGTPSPDAPDAVSAIPSAPLVARRVTDGVEAPGADPVALPTAAVESPVAAIAAPEFPTEFGGVFYLCNVLARPELVPAAWQALPYWRVLARLALALGLEPGDGLARWLEQLLGLARDGLAELEPLDGEAAAVAAILEACDERLAGHWLRQSATVRHTASHIDVYFDALPADIEIRLLGLDLDPGWLPDAGRVVLFHYPDQPVQGVHHGG